MAESPLEIYRRVLERSRAMPGEYSKAADEQRGGLDASMADITQSYAKRDPGGPLYAMAAGMLKKTAPWSFGNAFGSGLEAYKNANDQDADKEVERASKIALLRQARTKLSADVLNVEREGFGTQTGIAGGMNTIDRQAMDDKRRRESDERWNETLRMMGGAAPAEPPAGGVPGPGASVDPSAIAPALAEVASGTGDDVLAGGIVNESEDDLATGTTAAPRPAVPAQPQPAAPRPAAPQPAAARFNLTPEQIMILKGAGPERGPALLADMLRQNQGGNEMSPEGKKARDLGFKPGTPEFNEVVKKLLAGEYKPQGSSDTAEQRDRLAISMGLPKMPIDPAAGLMPANRERLTLQMMKDAEKAAAEADAAATSAKDQNDKMGRFIRLNRENPRTGPLWGWTPSLNNAAQEMDGISADAARDERQPGEGAVSDFDAKQFKLIVPSTSRTPEVNAKIIEARQAANNMVIQRAQYLRDYQTAYGHLHGAESAWKQYANDNPIYSREKEGELNPNRVDYRTYFSKGRTAPNPAQPGGAPAATGSGYKVIGVER